MIHHDIPTLFEGHPVPVVVEVREDLPGEVVVEALLAGPALARAVPQSHLQPPHQRRRRGHGRRPCGRGPPLGRGHTYMMSARVCQFYSAECRYPSESGLVVFFCAIPRQTQADICLCPTLNDYVAQGSQLSNAVADVL